MSETIVKRHKSRNHPTALQLAHEHAADCDRRQRQLREEFYQRHPEARLGRLDMRRDGDAE